MTTNATLACLHAVRDIFAQRPNGEGTRYICLEIEDVGRHPGLEQAACGLIDYIETALGGSYTITTWAVKQLGMEETCDYDTSALYRQLDGGRTSRRKGEPDFNELVRAAWVDRMIYSLETEGILP